MDLFTAGSEELLKKQAPLADRMRPKNLEQFFGQSHILAPGRLLRRAIEGDQLTSILLYGPPGTGKTTLARIIASHTKSQFITLNAVLSGVKDIRESIERAQSHFSLYSRRTILFIDEVHRFNKSQQDALLPHVEAGVVILIGATTENPYFEVNKALVSRSRVFELKPLQTDELKSILQSALSDNIRGLPFPVEVEEDAAEHLIDMSNGDARSLLNALELAALTTLAVDGVRRITLNIAEESIQKKAVLYDKDGDSHYDVISAFIKSIRGSDPDASLYWLARMIYAGEDPRFIFRRLLILASEDIGLADKDALQITVAASQAYDYMGMPEGRFPLAHATLYLATAPKSNSTMGFFEALRAVENSIGDVPNHLKDSSRDKDGLGHGAGYRYPHAFENNWVAQHYLPEELEGRVFYNPSGQGEELRIAEQLKQNRDLLRAAPIYDPSYETFIWDGSKGAWENRTFGDSFSYLSELRSRFFQFSNLSKDSLLLDLSERVTYLTEGVAERVSDGGVWFYSLNEAVENICIKGLPKLQQPITVNMAELIDENQSFTHIFLQNPLSQPFEKIAEPLSYLKGENIYPSSISIIQSVRPQKFSIAAYVELEYRGVVSSVEDFLYEGYPKDESSLVDLVNDLGLTVSKYETSKFEVESYFSKTLIESWFNPEKKLSKELLNRGVTTSDLERIRSVLQRNLGGKKILRDISHIFMSCIF